MKRVNIFLLLMILFNLAHDSAALQVFSRRRRPEERVRGKRVDSIDKNSSKSRETKSNSPLNDPFIQRLQKFMNEEIHMEFVWNANTTPAQVKEDSQDFIIYGKRFDDCATIQNYAQVQRRNLNRLGKRHVWISNIAEILSDCHRTYLEISTLKPTIERIEMVISKPNDRLAEPMMIGHIQDITKEFRSLLQIVQIWNGKQKSTLEDRIDNLRNSKLSTDSLGALIKETGNAMESIRTNKEAVFYFVLGYQIRKLDEELIILIFKGNGNGGNGNTKIAERIKYMRDTFNVWHTHVNRMVDEYNRITLYVSKINPQ